MTKSETMTTLEIRSGRRRFVIRHLVIVWGFAIRISSFPRKIGIRMALGAQAGGVLRLVLRQGLTLTLVGVAAGVCLSLASTRSLAGALYGVSLAACLIPARRGLKADPWWRLRHE